MHVLLVEPSMAWVMDDFVCFIAVVWEDDVGLNEVGGIDCSKIANSQGRVLDGSRDRSPNTEALQISVSITTSRRHAYFKKRIRESVKLAKSLGR